MAYVESTQSLSGVWKTIHIKEIIVADVIIQTSNLWGWIKVFPLPQ